MVKGPACRWMYQHAPAAFARPACRRHTNPPSAAEGADQTGAIVDAFDGPTARSGPGAVPFGIGLAPCTTDVIVRVTSTGICGSDLHLYEVLGPFLDEGDVLGHEAMGVVEEVGAEVTEVRVGDRVVVPFNISCGSCFMCSQGLQSQCETTQVHEHGNGRGAVRLHEALRPGAGRAGRAAARPVREHASDQGAGGPAGRPLRVPLRRAADRVAGGRVRRGAGRRHASSCSASGRSATWRAASRSTAATG